MAAAATAASTSKHQWSSHSKQKGRDNAKKTLCRNVTVHGYCKYEKAGCMYNHDPTRGGSQGQADSLTRRFNVDSPAFTPSSSDAGDNFQSAFKNATISPQAASAVPFTPKSKTGPSTSPAAKQAQTTEWTGHDIPEFIPQTFNHNQLADPATAASLSDPFNPYAEGASYAGLDGTASGHPINPYAGDSAQSGQAQYYQQQGSFAQPLQHHLYAPVGPHRENLLAYQRTAHDFFISENLRQELQRKNEATLQILPNSNLPTAIEHFHSLVPLDTSHQKSVSAFGYNSWVYKAVSSKDGYTYVLRRLEGFRLTSEKSVRTVTAWKRISNGGVVTTFDCFTTRAFGDSSLVFVTDFHPLSKTLAEHHLSRSSTYPRNRSPSTLIPEQVLWGYIVQLASAVKAIHSNGLAARLITPSKILLTNKNRIRLNACGILDVVQSNDPRSMSEFQHEDMQQLGRLILGLATNNPSANSNSKSIESMGRSYSDRLRHTVASLIDNPGDIGEFMSNIADQAFQSFDNVLHLEDELNSDLNRELENARLVRLLTKLGFINERPEFDEHAQVNGQWSETGERYYLKLFRDYVFHQVNHDGRPVVDLGHVLTCLNKLDAGSEEKIALVTRDEQNVLVVSYKELKRGLESSFQDLMKASPRRS